jgi:hypothetical protein
MRNWLATFAICLCVPAAKADEPDKPARAERPELAASCSSEYARSLAETDGGKSK